MSSKAVSNPFDLSHIADIPVTSSEQVEVAVAQAYSLFHEQRDSLPAYRRVEILEKLVELMSEQVEELTQLAASEGGKPYQDSKVEVMRAINGVKLALEHIPQIKGEEIPMGHTQSSANRMAFTQREAIGVVLSISAFNHPLNLIVHQVIPAIAVGCPVIVKPASATPMSCFKLAELLSEAGLPEGWCQPMICDNSDAEKMVADSRISFFSFIGSARIGWMLRSKLAPGTRCAMEHGGIAPVIVDETADMEPMIDSLLKGGFYHAGQVCVSVQRVYAPSSLSETIATKLADKASNLIVGDQLDPNTQVGPLISPKEVDRIEDWVNQAVESGAKLLCGGKRISDTCYQPTVLLNPSEDALVSTSEIFGPVVCVYSYEDKNDAIKRANNSPFGFQAAIFSNKLDDVLNISKQLNATAVMVNDHTAFRVDWMPFGGRGASGIGMGGIQYSMHEMTQDKMVVFNRG